MSKPATEIAPAPPPALRSAAEAEQVIHHLFEVMDELLAMVEQETMLVGGGNLAEAQKLEARKTGLSRMYIADTTRIRASQRFLNQTTPGLADDLRMRHDLFR